MLYFYIDRYVGQYKIVEIKMPKIVDKKEKARAISDAALKVFRKFGYPRTRMADIAEAAGIGKGTLYEYFRNKADILRFAFDEYFDIFSQGALEAMTGVTGPTQKLLKFVDFALGHIAEWEDHCVVYVDYFSSERSLGEDQFSLSCLYKTIKQVLMDLIKEGQAAGEIDRSFDPVAMAELFVSIYDGIILHRLFENTETDRESLRKAALALVKKGLLN